MIGSSRAALIAVFSRSHLQSYWQSYWLIH